MVKRIEKWVDLSPGGQVPYLLRVRSSKLKVKRCLGVFGRGDVREKYRRAFVIFKPKDPARWWRSSGAWCFGLGALEKLMTNTGCVICKQVD